MLYLRDGFFTALAAVFIMTQPAIAKCGLPREVQVLMDDLYASTLNGDSVDVELTMRLRRNSKNIDMADVSSKLFSVGMAHRRDRIDTLLKEAQLIDASGHAMNPNLLREQLKRAERLDAIVCKLEQREKDKNRPPPFPAAKEKRPSMPLTEAAQSLGTTARLVVLLSVTSLMIGLVFLGRFSYLWIHGLVNKRRTCHIPAVVECGLDVIDGYVTVLGRHGCRFQPVNEGAFARLEGLIGSRSAFIVCGSQRILVTLKATHGRSAVALFHSVLSSQAHTKLLERSKVSPKFAPKRSAGVKRIERKARLT
ncbi:hypothetical protein [Shimia gijangensis]|nr:hypothetical protein [Shimia gijangensis]